MANFTIEESLVGLGECKEISAAKEDVTGIGAFIIVSLLLGVFIEIIKRKLPWLALPYTLLVFLAGVVLEVVHENVKMGFVSDSIENWKALDPETLLFLFLPPLLFTSAFTVEYHIFRKLMGQAVLLATAGVVISALLLAATAIGLFGYDWGFKEGMLFGAMFGATDPVAVVALLHELGAPETLSVMIEGESLLNDGVGFVLFLVFFEQLSGRADYSFADIILKVLIASFGGIVVGCGVGFLGLVTMQQVWGDTILSFVITTIMVYATFFISEAFHVSGVVGVVFLGIFVAAYSDGYIQTEVLNDLKNFWRKIEFVANTLVFSFSGVVVAGILLSSDTLYQATFRDVINLVVLFILINVIRGIAVAVLYVPLKNMGYGLDLKQAALVSYAGMRGVVGLIAALIIVKDCSCAPGQIPTEEAPCITFATQSRMMFHMTGIVFWTLAINGTTTKYLVNYFQLNKDSAASKSFFEKATIKLHEHMNYVIESLKRHPHYREADWDTVWKYMPILSKSVFLARKEMGVENPRSSVTILGSVAKLEKERFVTSKQGNKVNALGYVDPEALGPPVTLDEQLEEARLRFLELIKASYRKQYQEGANKSWPELQVLIEAAMRCQDKPSQPIREWQDSVEPYLGRFNLCAAISTCEISKRSKPADGNAKAYEIATTFVRSHRTIIPKFKELCEESDVRVMQSVLDENSEMLSLAEQFVKSIEDQFPDIVIQVKTDVAIQRLLKEMANFSDQMLEHALIGEKDHHLIEHSLEESWHELRHRHASSFLPARMQGQPERRGSQPLTTKWKDFAIFSDVDGTIMQMLQSNVAPRQFAAGSVIAEQGTPVNGICVIIRGTVKLLSSSGRTRTKRGMGDVIGTIGYACSMPHPFTIIAETALEVLILPVQLLQNLLQRSPSFFANFYRDAGLLILESRFPQLKNPTFEMLRDLLPNIRIIRASNRLVANTSFRHPITVMEGEPVNMYGGIVIGFRGTMTEEGRSSRVSMHSVHRANRSIIFGPDSVAMFVTAEAAQLLESGNMRRSDPSNSQYSSSTTQSSRDEEQDPLRNFVRGSVEFNLGGLRGGGGNRLLESTRFS